MYSKLQEIAQRAAGIPLMTAAVPCPEEADTLLGIDQAFKSGLIQPHLFGDESAVKKLARESGIVLDEYELHHCLNQEESALSAVQFCREGKGEILIKGFLPTPIFLKAVLHKERGIGTGSLLSHIAVFEVPTIPRLLFLTDGGMVVAPTLAQKIEILQNALGVCHALGIREPKVAILASVETVSPEIPATCDAAVITAMWRRRQIKGCILDGPLALDNALSPQALKEKGIESPVGGNADILLVPNIESGNLLGKSFIHVAGGVMAGVVQGARVPIVLVSRVDPPDSKLFSVAIAAMISWQAKERV